MCVHICVHTLCIKFLAVFWWCRFSTLKSSEYIFCSMVIDVSLLTCTSSCRVNVKFFPCKLFRILSDVQMRWTCISGSWRGTIDCAHLIRLVLNYYQYNLQNDGKKMTMEISSHCAVNYIILMSSSQACPVAAKYCCLYLHLLTALKLDM